MPILSNGRDVDAAVETAEHARERRLLDTASMVERTCAPLGPHAAQDAAQDVMEAVWRAQHRPGFDDEARPLYGYAATVARYRVISGYRDRGHAPLPAGELGEVQWADPGPDPAEQFERADAIQEAARRVAELLAKLPPRERQVMLASELGSRSSIETGAELGMLPKTVRTAQARAMARMRELVGVPSPNPLASRVPENERRRSAAQARAVANGTAGVRRGGRWLPAEVHRAGLAAAAEGRSARQLAADFRVSEGTASRWRAQVRAHRIPDSAQDGSRDTPPARTVDVTADDGLDEDEYPGERVDDERDPLARARQAVEALPALTAAPSAAASCRNLGDGDGMRRWADDEAEDGTAVESTDADQRQWADMASVS